MIGRRAGIAHSPSARRLPAKAAAHDGLWRKRGMDLGVRSRRAPHRRYPSSSDVERVGPDIFGARATPRSSRQSAARPARKDQAGRAVPKQGAGGRVSALFVPCARKGQRAGLDDNRAAHSPPALPCASARRGRSPPAPPAQPRPKTHARRTVRCENPWPREPAASSPGVVAMPVEETGDDGVDRLRAQAPHRAGHRLRQSTNRGRRALQIGPACDRPPAGARYQSIRHHRVANCRWRHW